MKGEFSALVFFLSSVTDRSEEVNQYLNNVSIRPTGIAQYDFNQWIESGEDFEPHYSELFGEKKHIARNCMASALKHIVRISNPNLMKTPDGLIAKMDKDPEVK